MSNINKNKKFHFIYKTTNLLNDTFYIGMHSTSNLNDGYLGSGKRLRYSIRKYGEKNFKFEILEFLPNRETLCKREEELVNSDLIKEEKCLNLKPGGEGGFKNIHKESLKGVKRKNELLINDIEWTKYYKKQISDGLKIAYINGNKKVCKSFENKKHSDITKQKMSEKAKLRKGEKNSQYGTCWITNGKENKKIKKDTEIPEDWYLGRILRG